MSALPPKAGKQCYGLASAEADDAEIQDHSYKRVKQRLELRNRIAARAERLCSPLCPSHGAPCTVINSDCMSLVLCQLCCNCTHLLIDVVLEHALGKSRQLAFDISGMLR
jgi:hypothetical protein